MALYRHQKAVTTGVTNLTSSDYAGFIHPSLIDRQQSS